MRPGVRLALDWGQVRIGVAASDAEPIMAFPVTTLAADPAVLGRLASLVAEYQPVEIILGLPTNLAGQQGPAALSIRQIGRAVAAAFPGVPVRMVDERLTTVAASRQLRAAGRNTRSQRAVIDQAAAVALLEQVLDAERKTGVPPGELIFGGTDPGRTEPDE